MKKISMILALAATVYTANAQQQKGDFQLQGQISYNSTTVSGVTTSYSMIQVSASKFFTDQVEVGVSPLMMIGKDFGFTRLAFFSNYSFVTSDAKFVPYLGAQIMVNSQKVQGFDPITFQTTTTTKTSAGFGFRGGIRYFITEKVNIDVGPNISFGDQNSFIFTAGIGVILSKN